MSWKNSFHICGPIFAANSDLSPQLTCVSPSWLSAQMSNIQRNWADDWAAEPDLCRVPVGLTFSCTLVDYFSLYEFQTLISTSIHPSIESPSFWLFFSPASPCTRGEQCWHKLVIFYTDNGTIMMHPNKAKLTHSLSVYVTQLDHLWPTYYICMWLYPVNTFITSTTVLHIFCWISWTQRKMTLAVQVLTQETGNVVVACRGCCCISVKAALFFPSLVSPNNCQTCLRNTWTSSYSPASFCMNYYSVSCWCSLCILCVALFCIPLRSHFGYFVFQFDIFVAQF